MLALLALLATFGAATARDIVTITGGGPIGDGGAATGAYLRDLSAVVRDADGNVYIGEGYAARVRRVDAITGEITTYAGTGELGYSGDGGDATDAKLNYPYSLAVDDDGNLYISEGLGHRVRKVTPGGTISTVAGDGTAGYGGDGGAATSAQLNGPRGLAVDADGNLFIADESNSLIRRVDALTQEITTVAGDGAADFYGDGGPATAAALNFPADVEVDGDGNLYISDSGNSRIRRVDAGTGDIATFAGDGGCCFGGFGGPATSANVGTPLGISLADDGSLFIVDLAIQGVLKVDTSNNLDKVAGGNLNGFGGDGGPANSGLFSGPLDVAATTGDGFLVADNVNHRVRVVASGTLATFAGGTALLGDGGPAANANVMSPYDIAFDDDGNLYFTDRGGQTIRRIDAGTGTISTVAGSGLTGLVNGAPASAQFFGPTRLLVSPDGGVVITDRSNRVIRALNAAGDDVFSLSTPGANPVVEGATMLASRFNLPNGLALSPDFAYLYIASTNNHRIRRWDIANDVVTTIAGTGTFGSTGDGGAATSADIAQPFSLSIDAGGNLYFAELAFGRVRRVTPGGIISTVAGTGTPGNSGDGGQATVAEITPHSTAIGADGALYISQNANCAIRRVDLGTGVITRFAGTGTCGVADDGPALSTPLNQPFGIAWSGDSLYLAEIGSARIRRVQPGVPAAPVITSAVGGETQVTVGFSAPDDDGSPITGYTVTSSPAGGVDTQAGSTSLSHVVTGLTGGQAYTFTVRATNAAGEGPASDPSDPVTPSPPPNLSIADASLVEGDTGAKTLKFTITLSGTRPTPVSFDVTTSDGSATTADGDYIAKTTTGQTIAAGATSTTFNVQVPGDASNEANETFVVTLSNPVGSIILGDATATGTIVNNDGPTLSVGDVSVTESQSGTRLATFAVRLSAVSAMPVTFDIATSDISASAGSDYVGNSADDLVIAAGQLQANFAVTINGDTSPEPTETYRVTLSDVSGASVSDGEAIGTILDGGSLSLSVADKSIVEGQSGTKILRFVVRLSGVTASPVTYDITTVDGSALAGSDYVANAGDNLTIPGGAQQANFDVVINGDTVPEAAETFTVVVSDVSGATLADGSATGTINDGGSVSISIADKTIIEGLNGSSNLRFTVRLSALSGSPVSFDFATSDVSATAGLDYTGTALVGQVIPAGTLSVDIDVPVLGDTLAEPTETFNATLANVSGATVLDGLAVGTIRDGGLLTLSIVDRTLAEGPLGTRTASFTVRLSAPWTSAVSFDIATLDGTATTANGDYIARSVVGAQIPAGATKYIFQVTVQGDAVAEPDEQFTVEVDNVTQATVTDGTAVGTITNDD